MVRAQTNLYSYHPDFVLIGYGLLTSSYALLVLAHRPAASPVLILLDEADGPGARVQPSHDRHLSACYSFTAS